MEMRLLADDPDEIGVVARWLYDEWGTLAPGRSLETAHEKVRQCFGGDELPLTIVCALDGVLVGTAGIDTADMATHPELTPWMVSVYVAQAHRRKGIGSALCRRIEDEFQRLGVQTAYLFTPDQEPLYARLGWKAMSREDYHGESVVIMCLDLE